MASLYIYWPSVLQVMDSDTYQTTAEKLWLSKFVFVVAASLQGYNKVSMNTLAQDGRKASFVFVLFFNMIEKILKGGNKGRVTCLLP